MTQELWEPVRGYRGLYEVSSLGRVRSLRTDRILNPQMHVNGVRHICLLNEKGRGKNHSIASLVLSAFRPSQSNRRAAKWRNGDKSDNRLENLDWLPGPAAKLSDESVRVIRTRWMNGETGKALAREFKISECSINNLISGKTYFHVE